MFNFIIEVNCLQFTMKMIKRTKKKKKTNNNNNKVHTRTQRKHLSSSKAKQRKLGGGRVKAKK